MGARKFHDFDADEFKRTVSEEYKNEVTKRLYEERKRLNLKGTDMSCMLSIATNTYYEAEHGNYSIKNRQIKIMYEHGFDVEYIFTGKRTQIDGSKDGFEIFDDNEIENLLRSFCGFIRDFKNSYVSLGNIYDENNDLFYFVINKSDDHNVYEIYRTYNSYNQEEMAIRIGYSLNKYKKLKKTSAPLRPDSKQIYTIYKGLNISPLMCLDDRESNICELMKLAMQLEPEAREKLNKMNPTLYKVLYCDLVNSRQ
jgi:transcriptional regulator with XRE-family HTH domain